MRHFKETKGHFYFVRNELANNPIKYVKSTGRRNFQVKSIKLDQLNKNSLADDSFRELVPNGFKNKKIALRSTAELNKIKGKTKYLTVVQLNSFDRDWPFLLKIEHKQAQSNLAYSHLYSNSKAATYQLILGMSKEMKILGYSLAFVFGASLIAILIIVVKAAKRDQKFTNERLAQRTWQSKTGLLFFIPAIFGVFDVLFGLRFFNQVLPTAYYEVWLPIVLMLLAYFAIYLLTVMWHHKVEF